MTMLSRQLKSSVIGILLLIPTVANGQDRGELAVHPKTCVIDPETHTCRVKVHLHYNHTLTQSACLIADSINSLKCFGPNNTIDYIFQVTTDQPINFELRTIHDDAIIATAVLDVAKLVQKTRRRRGIGWNIL